MAQSIFMLNLKTIIYDVFQTIFLPDLLTALTPLYSQEPLAQQLKSIIENKKATVGIAIIQR